ncbi:MAG TPA: metallophosphoesterase [Pseudomonas sp.]|jgi:diadenosine tetraphosphatase ApaH/serine/threonine PP2A family protein phosphatase|nr:metallophosphoesterase [Pseudomonas sp.]
MHFDPLRGYDIIGDVHGCAEALRQLLERLGYRLQAGVWQHPQRKALFLGDIIDRGPQVREALHIVRDMVQADQALCIMGNHEFSALGWATPAPPGSGRVFVREHIRRHAVLLQETHRQFEAYPEEWQGFLDWFQELPLFVDAGAFRLVHACWDSDLIDMLREHFPDGRVDRAFVRAAGRPDSFAAQAFNRLLRGLDMRLPEGVVLTSREGFPRTFFRTKFWEEDPQTYGDIAFQPEPLPEHVASTPLTPPQKRELLRYGPDEPPLFVGHYWRDGRPAPIRHNLACLDYSAVLEGRLVAYRFDGEHRLHADKFVWVEVDAAGAPR